jgi:para-nitrobenzyl esterase
MKNRYILLGALVACAAWSPVLAAADDGPLQVNAPAGPVRGVLENGTTQFRGIPYAKPPTGDLRWRPPVAEPTWTTLRDATAFGRQCAHISTMGTFAGPPTDNEDCLSLNVFAPNGATSTSRLPVIIWFHGGGNFTGSGDAYDGSGLVKAGHVIVVTVNYRLGVFGFLAHPGLDSEGHPFANYGLLDQQGAMKWVKANITAFGGDPTNVTIGGQSAGSIDVQAHMTSPMARGLFARVIMESGSAEAAPLPTAEARGVRISSVAGCGNDARSVDCMRNLPAERLMAAEAAQPQRPTDSGLVSDGQIIPAVGLAATFAAGQFAPFPVLSSTTRDEWNFVIAVQHYALNGARPLGTADYDAFVDMRANKNPDVSARIKAMYPLSNYSTPQRAISAIGTEGGPVFQCATRQRLAAMSKAVPVYAYQFNDRTAPSNLPAMSGHEPLADHAADIQYLFPGFRGGPRGVSQPLNAVQTKLSRRLMTAWTNFARTGNPNEPGKIDWPRYNRAGKPAIIIADLTGLTAITDDKFAANNKCDFWATIPN